MKILKAKKNGVLNLRKNNKYIIYKYNVFY